MSRLETGIGYEAIGIIITQCRVGHELKTESLSYRGWVRGGKGKRDF